jgi:hypothetical protein
MTDYFSVGNAIKTTLLADSWIGNSVNVKTVEIFTRGFSIQTLADAQSFDENDLPALAIVPNAMAKSSDQVTSNEIRSLVKPGIITVTRSSDPQTGGEDQNDIVANIERVLEKQKTSTQALGIDAYVFNVATTDQQFKHGTYYYFVSTTTCNIEIQDQF